MDCELPFSATIPGNPTAATLSEFGADPQKKQELILLVDDELMIRQLCGQILLRCGYPVLLARDGAEALELYRSRKSEISLVILDMTMPRLSGPETLKQLIALNAEVRVLLFSGSTLEMTLQKECRQVVGLLNKPFRAEQLTTQLRALFNNPAQGALSESKV